MGRRAANFDGIGKRGDNPARRAAMAIFSGLGMHPPGVDFSGFGRRVALVRRGLAGVDCAKCKKCVDERPEPQTPFGMWCIGNAVACANDCAAAAAVSAAQNAASDLLPGGTPGSGGGRGTSAQGAVKTGVQLARGDVRVGDYVTDGRLPLTVIEVVEARGPAGMHGKVVTVVLHNAKPMSESVAKMVRTDGGGVFYRRVIYVGAGSSGMGKSLGTTKEIQFAPYASWNGFLRWPAQTIAKVQVADLSWKELLSRPFGGTPAGYAIRRAANQGYTGPMNEGSVEERTFFAVEAAETAAAVAAVKAGMSEGQVVTEAAVGLATALVQAFTATTWGGIPSGFQNMTSKALFDVVLAGRKPQVATPPPGVPEPIPERDPDAGGWGKWVGIGVGVLALGAVAFALSRRRRSA